MRRQQARNESPDHPRAERRREEKPAARAAESRREGVANRPCRRQRFAQRRSELLAKVGGDIEPEHRRNSDRWINFISTRFNKESLTGRCVPRESCELTTCGKIAMARATILNGRAEYAAAIHQAGQLGLPTRDGVPCAIPSEIGGANARDAASRMNCAVRSGVVTGSMWPPSTSVSSASGISATSASP